LRHGGAGERQTPPPGEYWRAGRHIPNDADTREISVPKKIWRDVKTHVAYSAVTDVRICFVGSYGLDFKMKCSCKVQRDRINTKVIIDLEMPLNGRMSLQNLYVMLSWVTCWANLAILRPFDDSIFEMNADKSVLKFHQYLEDVDNTVVECMSIKEIKRSIGI
jgi:hypothetical protein